MTKTKKKPGYEVGYKKPPRDMQFKPGQSGNLRGRPRRSRNLGTVLRTALMQNVRMTKDGATTQVPAVEALALKLVDNGLKGTPADVVKLLYAIERLSPSMAEPESTLPEKIQIEYVKSDRNGRPLNLTEEEIDEVLAKRKRLFVESKASDADTASEDDEDEPDFLK